MSMDELRQQVERHLGGGNGHGIDHVMRVGKMATAFAAREGADPETVELIALLHDVDDYKLFGLESAKNLTHAQRFLDEYTTVPNRREQVLASIATMGYNKYLEGIRPTTIEGMVVSDADMCDAIGAEGVLRTHAYALASGHDFFDDTLAPTSSVTDATVYRAGGVHSVQHFFDKLLIIPGIMMTEAGRDEATKREDSMINFLQELFRERGSDEWQRRLEAHLKQR